MLLLCALAMHNALAWERYRIDGDAPGEVAVKRGTTDPRYMLKDSKGEILVDNERMFRLDRPEDDAIKNALFTSGTAPRDAECYFTAIMTTLCWVPAGTRIVRRGNASDAFATTSGVVLCADSVAGQGPCMEVQPMTAK